MINKERNKNLKNFQKYFRCEPIDDNFIKIVQYVSLKRKNGTYGYMGELFIPNNVAMINEDVIEEFSYQNYLKNYCRRR